ncbi:penicillin-binding transpeptidase domain-containing protein [Virgibacillus senegalensis]|uniref:penicillin-binding transpeptidase domain-containing protein n=1 Tax=Virgibacillus senegalensis TaxID=1499679 RepID=UPI00069E90B4|nr:penicillin-binding transpeptidase domain-containing protein [Virgibacillus senegalensis]
MKKIYSLLAMMTLIAVLSACSNDEVTPEERMDEFVDHWNEQDFKAMYDMASSESKEAYPTEEFVDRYEKIYNDLNVENLNVSYEKPEEGEENSQEDETAKFPVSVEMDTVGGPISFEYDATLNKTEDDEGETDWVVNWDPGYIFPQLKDGGEISFQTESPERGEIFDRNENGLAVNEEIYEIGVVPGEFGEDAEETKEKIAYLLSMDVDTINAALEAEWVQDDSFVPLKKVPKTNEEQLDALFELGPVLSQTTTGRVYPYGEAASHLVGYIGSVTAEEIEEADPGEYSNSDIIGKRGLELLFEDRLKGEPGVTIAVTKDGEEDQVLTQTEVKNGEDITVTIDADIQESIYNSYEDQSGTAAVVQPKTGETLALVSAPGFDPNELAYGISQSRLEELQDDEQHPLQNRFSATFAPGSSIKPITAAIGLEAGAIDPNEAIEINGLKWQKDESWGDYRVTRVSEGSPVDLTDALVRSDNIYFAKQALEIGSDNLIDGLNQFGVGEDFPYTYPIEASSVSNNGKIDSEAMLADTSYGQGQLEMSALHLAAAYTTLLNNGNMIQPTLEESEEDGQVWKEGVVSEDNISIIRGALRKVVSASNGTAHSAASLDINLSGKTGTAELKKSLDDEDGEENGWFVTYPEDEDMLISMMMENVKDQGGSHIVVDRAVEALEEIK